MLLVFGVNGSKAQELAVLTADLGTIETQGSAAYDKDSHKLTFDAPWSCAAVVRDVSGIPVYQAKTLTITCSEATTGYRLDIYLTDGTLIQGSESEGTRFSGDNAAADALSQTFDLTTILAAYQKKTIDYLRINTALASGTTGYITLSNIALAYDANAELEEEELGEGYVDMDVSFFKEYASIDKEAEVVNANPGCEYNIGKEVAAGGTVYGNGSVGALTYADLSAYDQLILTVASGTPRLLFNRTTNTSNDYLEINSAEHELVTVDEDGKWIVDLKGVKTKTNLEYVHLNVIKATWGGAATIKRAVLHEAEITFITAVSGHEFDLQSFTFGKWDGYDGNASMTETIPADIRIGESGNGGTEIFGKNGNVANECYADLTGYSKMMLEGTAGKQLRVMINRQADNSLTELNPTFNPEGLAEIDLSNYEYVHLNSIKVNWGNDGTTVTKIALYKDDAKIDYYLTGEGELDAVATAALADASATIYDATGVTAAGIELTPANPNAIFVANEGALANTQNVCVGGVIDNLNLVDDNPFALPADAKANYAYYVRQSQPNPFGTVCLPFALDETFGTKIYAPAGISAEGALLLDEMDNLPAGVPAIIYSEEQTYKLYRNREAEPFALSDAKTSNGTVQLTGSYAAESIDVTAEPALSYYAISNNQFVQATATLNVKPFRAYLTTQAGAAKERLSLQPGEATAISALTADDTTVEAIYNAAGARLNCLQKGLNIVKMQDGTTTKVYVK
jgi:hypothetical protein